MGWPEADGIEKNKQGRIVPVDIPMAKVNDNFNILTEKVPITELNVLNDIVLRLRIKFIPLY